jgi:hypothetical protein
MKTFQEFLEQAGSPTMKAHQDMYAKLATKRAEQRIRQNFWRQRDVLRTKHRQDAEMHSDMERRHALP